MMQALQAPFPALGVDTITILDAVRCQGLRAAGYAFVVRYLGSLTAPELDTILQSGLLVSVVTYADVWDPERTVAELRALGVPPGCTIWLDLEGIGADVPAQHVIDSVNAWADAVIAAKWEAGLYVGAGCGLAAAQLYSLHVTRYWRSQSMVPEPACGFVMTQFQPSITVAGTLVDVDVSHEDYRGRRATFVGPGPSQVDTVPELANPPSMLPPPSASRASS